MDHFPSHLLDGYRNFMSGRYASEEGRYRQLAEILGDDHDLAILYQVVSAEAAATGHDADLVDLTIGIDARRSALERTAFELGSRVYERRPKALMEQIERWWKA